MKRDRKKKFLRPEGCLSPNEAAKSLGITGEAVKQWIYHGRLVAAKDPDNGYWWVRKADFDKFVQERQSPKRLEFKLQKR